RQRECERHCQLVPAGVDRDLDTFPWLHDDLPPLSARGRTAQATMVFDVVHSGKSADVKTVISLPSSRR
ncbi:MAG: hypothetical protein ACRCWE_08105, partial [Stenotrophomonas maltophilia]